MATARQPTNLALLKCWHTVGARREVFFETNGVPRMVEIEDRRQAVADAQGAAKRAGRERADPTILGSVASPMSGEIIDIVAKPGARG